MSVTFRQLEIFEAINRTGSFAAAANQLNISQASVSKQVAALEAHLGITLFVRERGRKAELTPEARYLPPKVGQLLKLAIDLLPQTAETKVVRMTCGDIIGAMVYDNLPGLLHRYPQLELEVVLKEPALQSVTKAWDENMDLACFTLLKPPPIQGAECIAKVRVGIFVKKGSKLERDWLASSDLSLPVIFPLQGTYLERNFTESLNLVGLRRHHVTMRVQNEQSRVELALNGAGAIFAPYGKVKKEIAEGLLVPLNIPDYFVYRYIFINPKIVQRQEINWVVEFLRRIISYKR